MIVRRPIRLKEQKTPPKLEQKLRVLNQLQHKCVKPELDLKEFEICACSVCCNKKQILEELHQIYGSVGSTPNSLQQLLKLVAAKDSAKEPARLQLFIPEICFFSSSKPTSLFLSDAGQGVRQRRVTLKEAGEILLCKNSGTMWVLLDTDLNLKLLCRNELYYYLRPGSKTKPLKTTVYLQSYLTPEESQFMSATEFQYSDKLQTNKLFVKAKAKVLFGEDYSPVTPLTKAYQIYHTVLRNRNVRIEYMVLRFVIQTNGSVALVACKELVAAPVELPEQPLGRIQMSPPNPALIDKITSYYENAKQAIKNIQRIDQDENERLSDQVFAQLYSTRSEQFSSMLQRADFYKATNRLFAKKHKFILRSRKSRIKSQTFRN